MLLMLMATSLAQVGAMGQRRASAKKTAAKQRHQKKQPPSALAKYGMPIAIGVGVAGMGVVWYGCRQDEAAYVKALKKVFVDEIFLFEQQASADLQEQFGKDAHRTDIWINKQQVIRSAAESVGDFEVQVIPLLGACGRAEDLPIITAMVAQTAMNDLEARRLELLGRQGYGFGRDPDADQLGEVRIVIDGDGWSATRVLEKEVRVFEMEKIAGFEIKDTPRVQITTTMTTDSARWQAQNDKHKQTIPFDVTYALTF